MCFKLKRYKWFKKENRNSQIIFSMLSFWIFIIGVVLGLKTVLLGQSLPYPGNSIATLLGAIFMLLFYVVSQAFKSDYETEDRLERLESKLRLKVEE